MNGSTRRRTFTEPHLDYCWNQERCTSVSRAEWWTWMWWGPRSLSVSHPYCEFESVFLWSAVDDSNGRNEGISLGKCGRRKNGEDENGRHRDDDSRARNPLQVMWARMSTRLLHSIVHFCMFGSLESGIRQMKLLIAFQKRKEGKYFYVSRSDICILFGSRH